MILEEFDLEKHFKLEKKSHAEGHAKGLTAGRAEFAVLTQHLLADSRIDD